jgi:hypothetical protein
MKTARKTSSGWRGWTMKFLVKAIGAFVKFLIKAVFRFM